MDFGTAIGTENTRSSVPELIKGEVTLATPKLPDPSRSLSASPRTLIRKYFTETTPPILPAGHATVMFNEHQVHSVLRVVSDDTVITSLHLMKNMLEEAMRIGARFRDGTPGPRCTQVHCFRNKSASSVADGSQSGDETGAYSSRVFSSDDDFSIFDSQQKRPYSPTISHVGNCYAQQQDTSHLTNAVPSPRFSAAD